VKPPPFAYHRPSGVEEALDVLARVGGDGKVLAGGQSLVPLLNMRLAEPANLVDINRLHDLAFVRVESAGSGTNDAGVRVGALARHADVEHDAAAAGAVPLLRQALRNVAHPTIRNRGTTVGSIAHADPSGEMTAVLALLGGSVELRSAGSSRVVGAEEFFLGPLESCIEAGEMAVSAFFPAPDPHTGSAWLEVSRRHGDYAMCGVGALVSLDDDLRITSARAGYVSMSPTPAVLDLGEALVGRAVDAADWAAAGRQAVASLEPEEDIHATAEYRGHLAGVLTGRALAAAGRHAARRITGRPDDTAEDNR
jgi:carbon-monoxide dehydrogenase medium subunit